MWKVLWTFAVLSLVAGGETIKVASNLTSNELIQNQNNASTNLASTEDKKVIPMEVPINVETEVEGSPLNPINPFKHATDDASIGNFKYYFVLLAFSSLSVIAIIVFKALR